MTIQNIKVNKNPVKGKIVAYMPNSSDGRLFNNSPETIIENSLTYKGGSKSDSKTLEIGNQGGTAVVRFAVAELGKYISNDDEEIRHDASLLKKINTTEEDIESEVTFDFVIKLSGKSYTSKITLKIPCDGLVEQGTSSTEITDGFVFKKVKN